MNHVLQIGALIFPRINQIDFTGPFEVLCRLPNSTFHVAAKERAPVKDVNGLILTPTITWRETPPLNLLVIPGGEGIEDVIDDPEAHDFLRKQLAGRTPHIFSVCTGALFCAAAGLLRGKRATTHWRSFHLLEHYGAVPVNQRVVSDGNITCAAGVTAGIDGALVVAAKFCGERVAQSIQLAIEYAPEPPFNAGGPEMAPRDIVEEIREKSHALADRRLARAKRFAEARAQMGN